LATCSAEPLRRRLGRWRVSWPTGGRYSFHGDRVEHHVELSLFPNWAGGNQERSVELTGDRLTLSARPLLLAGKQQVPRLVWERVDPSPGAA
jgi:hypothetical protein